MAVKMSCNSAFSFTLFKKTLPVSYTSFSPSNLFLSHRKLLAGDLPEFPHKRPIPQPSVPLEVPPISTRPETDPTAPPELPPAGPDFPEMPAPSPPGPEFPVPPAPSPRKPPDIEPPRPGSPVPGPDILPPPVPEELSPRPAGPEILTAQMGLCLIWMVIIFQVLGKTNRIRNGLVG